MWTASPLHILETMSREKSVLILYKNEHFRKSSQLPQAAVVIIDAPHLADLCKEAMTMQAGIAS